MGVDRVYLTADSAMYTIAPVHRACSSTLLSEPLWLQWNSAMACQGSGERERWDNFKREGMVRGEGRERKGKEGRSRGYGKNYVIYNIGGVFNILAAAQYYNKLN